VIGGDAGREIGQLGHFDLIVVDPPRAGLPKDVITSLASSKARAVAYVSCDPATLARDAKLLQKAGLRMIAATPIDLFPQSYHVETVAVFRR
jgi:23S rRNA (uracil1939-C5)-methyltransferase